MEPTISNKTGTQEMLDLPETLDDLRLQQAFFNATRLLRWRTQKLDQRDAPQLQPTVGLLDGRGKKDLSGWRSLEEGVDLPNAPLVS